MLLEPSTYVSQLIWSRRETECRPPHSPANTAVWGTKSICFSAFMALFSHSTHRWKLGVDVRWELIYWRIESKIFEGALSLLSCSKPWGPQSPGCLCVLCSPMSQPCSLGASCRTFLTISFKPHLLDSNDREFRAQVLMQSPEVRTPTEVWSITSYLTKKYLSYYSAEQAYRTGPHGSLNFWHQRELCSWDPWADDEDLFSSKSNTFSGRGTYILKDQHIVIPGWNIEFKVYYCLDRMHLKGRKIPLEFIRSTPWTYCLLR